MVQAACRARGTHDVEDGKRSRGHGGHGARISYTLDGYLPKHILVTKVESREVSWGTASLALTVVDAEGNPTDARVFLDDEALWAPEGVLSVAGLDAGPHRVLIAAAGSSAPGIELRLLLRDGEKRTKTVALPPPD